MIDRSLRPHIFFRRFRVFRGSLCMIRAKKLEMPKTTLMWWVKRGWIHVSRQLPGYRGRLIFWADARELARLRQLRKAKHCWGSPPVPKELTTPAIPAAHRDDAVPNYADHSQKSHD